MRSDARKKAVGRIISRWSQQPRESAQRLIAEYGPPAEYSESQLIWSNAKEGWKIVLELPRQSTALPIYDSPNPSQAEGDLDVVDEALKRAA